MEGREGLKFEPDVHKFLLLLNLFSFQSDHFTTYFKSSTCEGESQQTHPTKVTLEILYEHIELLEKMRE
jgi:hypothetical protein